MFFVQTSYDKSRHFPFLFRICFIAAESHEAVFQADKYAATIAGGNNLITALDRIGISKGSYATALNAATTFMKDKLQSIISRNEKDIATLKTINTSFDFDGKRYLCSDTNLIIAKIEEENIVLKEKQSKQDKEAFTFFYQQHKFSEAAAEIIRLINILYTDTSAPEEIQLSLHKAVYLL